MARGEHSAADQTFFGSAGQSAVMLFLHRRALSKSAAATGKRSEILQLRDQPHLLLGAGYSPRPPAGLWPSGSYTLTGPYLHRRLA